jgi:hypothetical protein
MKKMIAAVLAVLSAATFADTYVKPYVRKDGTYVQGHYRSNADGNVYNNYSTQGNTNPYTGQSGTVNPNNAYVPPNRQSGYAQPKQNCYTNTYGTTICN